MKKLRNIAILGHQGSGKTTLVESLYSITSNQEKGSIEKKNTISDFLKEEKERQSSISTSVIPINYNEYKLNLLDIPGQDDFIWEAISVTHSVKASILVIDACNPIQINTIKHFKMLRKNNIPTLIYVNKMDKVNLDFESIFTNIKKHLGDICIPFTYPLGHNDNFDGFVNVVDLKARRYNGKECVDDIIHDDKKAKIFELHNTICEAVAIKNDVLLDKFFNGEVLTKDEIHTGLRKSILTGELIPIIFGSATKNIGLHTLLNMLIDYMPNPNDLKPYEGNDLNGNKVFRKTIDEEPFSAYVIKTTSDLYQGLCYLLKIDSGTLKIGDEVYCPNNKNTYKITSLFYLLGKKQIPTDEVRAGDIVAISKIDGLKTSYTITSTKNIILYPEIKFPTAVYFKSISVKNKKDEDKIGNILSKLMLEDPTIEVRQNQATKQQLLGCLSETHLDFIINKIKQNYNVDLLLSVPKVAYKETITKEVEGEGRYIKQSGGNGFYGVVRIKFSPDNDILFSEEIYGGSVPKNYFPACEKGFIEAVKEGLLAGFPVTNIKATLIDGKYHPVDSNELSFKMATILAFKDAYLKANPTLLEPILQLKININNEYIGDVLSDLNNRRAKVINLIDKEDSTTQIIANVPEAEVIDYVTKLRAITQGSGYFNQIFYTYEEVPAYLKAKVIEENSLLK